MKSLYLVISILAASACLVAAQGLGGQAQSPASQRPPQTVNAQSYPPDLVRTGQTRFGSECGFCHGRDATGGETGPDLTRSTLVAQDLRGDKIGSVVRSGRIDKGMPAFDLSEADLNAVVAFIHDQKTKSESLGGGRRAVDVSDLDTGNAEAGKSYFQSNCAKCHSPTGDLAGVGTRFRGLALLQRMLYPPTTRPQPAPAKVTVTLATGEAVTGSLVSKDEFTIVLTDTSGSRRSWSTSDVKFVVDDPVATHFDQLSKYSDDDMHNVYAYIQTLQ